jgi:hypothetical protein
MPISHIYPTAEAASAVVDELKEAGFTAASIALITAAESPTLTSITTLGVPKVAAESYLTRIGQGEALIVMDVPFGWGLTATAILSKSGDGENEVSPAVHELIPRDPATPLSSAFQIPVLSHNPTPLSSLLRMPTLSAKQAPRARSFGLPTLLQKAAPFSDWIKMKLLLQDPTPLSNRVHFKPLLNEAAPLSSRAKLPLLSNNAEPLSKRINMKVLSDHPAPLSELLGLPVLTKPRSGRS